MPWLMCRFTPELLRATLICCLCSFCLTFSIASPGDDTPTKEQLDFFESKIRPVLVSECYGCHSEAASAEGKLRGGLFLDSRDASRQGGDSGPATVPGDLEQSLLISAIKHEGFEMPPKGKLDEAVITDFENWVKSGAADPRDGKVIATAAMDVESRKSFWSFQPLATPKPPSVVDATKWVRNDIDRYVLSKLEDNSVVPNSTPRASILVRRAWFDLLGLPPTPADMREWTGKLEKGKLEDPSGKVDNTAWASLIDHLLESPHYGERQARHWIDVARFAESHGYEQDYDRANAYHYRDFLIRAFNQDLPYDQFVQWQLAGDEIAPDEPLAWMATGFLCGGAFPTQLTEAEFESARYDELDDMAATTGVAFLGLSVGCARCHDHKFDPIPSIDYYRIASTFTTAIRCEKQLDLEPEENAKRRAAYLAELSSLEKDLERYTLEELPTKLFNWLRTEDSSTIDRGTWTVLSGDVQSNRKDNFQPQPDGSYLSVGAAPKKDVIKLTATVQDVTIQSLRLEALTHDSLPHKGPGRADNGNFALGDIQLSIKGLSREETKFTAARTSFQQNADSLSVAGSIDDDPVSGWAVDGEIGKDQAAVFELAKPLHVDQPTDLTITLTFNHPNGKHSVGRFRLSVSSDAAAQPSIGNIGEPQQIVDATQRLRSVATSGTLDLVSTHSDWLTVLEWFKLKDDGFRERSNAIAEGKKKGAEEKLATAMVTSEGLPILSHHANGRGFPHFYPETFMLRRGDVSQKMEKVESGFLQVLTSTSTDPQRWQLKPEASESRLSYRRTALARWLTDSEQVSGQLAARVAVNRLWQHHFGRGIVATPNDFGSSGDRPTHSELLDYLSTELIDGGWRLKRLHKLIMTSSVYMQSSSLEVDDERLALDRENQLLWRRVPRRLEAEAIRDAMLLVGGQLDKTMYGPGSLDASMHRRSVYLFIKRSQLVPMMMLFDWPEHLVSIGQRPLTTIAPQALMFMNSSHGREYAMSLAKRVLENASADDLEAAIDQAYWTALTRSANEAEKELAVDFLKQQTIVRKESGEPDAELLAFADFCQTLMSMNEFVYVE